MKCAYHSCTIIQLQIFQAVLVLFTPLHMVIGWTLMFRKYSMQYNILWICKNSLSNCMYIAGNHYLDLLKG